MRIAYITQSYPPMVSGASIVVQQLASGMADRGHRVLVISASDRRSAYTKTSGNLHLVRLRSIPNPLRVNQNFFLWSRDRIISHVKKFNPDIIHIHNPFALGVPGLSTIKSFGFPVIITVHQVPWFISAYLPDLSVLHRVVEGRFWKFGNQVLALCDEVVVPSQSTADEILSQGNSPPEVISNGVELSQFTPTPTYSEERQVLCRKYGINPTIPVILHVGRLDADKRVEFVIQAAALVIRRMNAQLLVVGDGTKRKKLQQLSFNLGIGDQTIFTGYVECNGDLPGLYRLATVFAMASEIETQGAVILEALASGLPVVAVCATCIPELVRDAVNGYLVAPGYVAGMADGIEQVLKSPSKARQMGIECRAMAERHRIEKTFDEYESLYKSTIQGSYTRQGITHN